MFKYLIYKFGQFWVNYLPLKWSYRIAMFMSDMHFCMSFRDRHAVIENLKVVLPEEKDIPHLAREVFRNFGKYLVEFFRMVNAIDDQFIREKIKIRNLEVLGRVCEQKKGGIILTAHIGNWEMGGALLSKLGYPSLAIALPHKERPVNNLFNEQRKKRGLKVVSTQLALRACLDSLRNNKLIAVVGDRDFSATGKVMDFLGRRALIPTGAAMFACKTGAPIIPAFLIRNDDDSFTMNIEDPIYPSEDCSDVRDSEQAVEETIKKYLSVIEAKIRKYPTQWLVFRRFWVEE